MWEFKLYIQHFPPLARQSAPTKAATRHAYQSPNFPTPPPAFTPKNQHLLCMHKKHTVYRFELRYYIIHI
jgi:hypothetical protein